MIQAVRYTWRFLLAYTLVAIVVVMCAANGFAATYYLNPAHGNDGNPGRKAARGKPWRKSKPL